MRVEFNYIASSRFEEKNKKIGKTKHFQEKIEETSFSRKKNSATAAVRNVISRSHRAGLVSFTFGRPLKPRVDLIQRLENKKCSDSI